MDSYHRNCTSFLFLFFVNDEEKRPKKPNHQKSTRQKERNQKNENQGRDGMAESKGLRSTETTVSPRRKSLGIERSLGGAFLEAPLGGVDQISVTSCKIMLQ